MIKSFQGLRVICMLFIFMFHLEIMKKSELAYIYKNLFSDGYFGVVFFFILSGFLTYKKISKVNIKYSIRNSVIFWWNKIKRIYSAFNNVNYSVFNYY